MPSSLAGVAQLWLTMILAPEDTCRRAMPLLIQLHLRPAPHLDKSHLVVGRVLSGMEVVRQIERSAVFLPSLEGQATLVDQPSVETKEPTFGWVRASNMWSGRKD